MVSTQPTWPRAYRTSSPIFFLLFSLRERFLTVKFFNSENSMIFDISQLSEPKYSFSKKCCMYVCMYVYMYNKFVGIITRNCEEIVKMLVFHK